MDGWVPFRWKVCLWMSIGTPVIGHLYGGECLVKDDKVGQEQVHFESGHRQQSVHLIG